MKRCSKHGIVKHKIKIIQVCSLCASEKEEMQTIDAQQLKSKIADLETILCNVNGKEGSDNQIISDVCKQMRQLQS